MGAPKGGKGEWGLCLWATLPNSELANAAESPTAPELSPRPRQDSLQRQSAAEHRARRGLGSAGPAASAVARPR